MLIEKIKMLAQKYAGDFVEIRQHLHANPELSYLEFETSKFIQQCLATYGIPFTVMATTGVVGIIEAKIRLVALSHCAAIWMHYL